MTQQQIKAVQDTWDFVITNTKEAGNIFYTRLFEQSPHLRKLFKDDNREQERKLIQLITFAVSKLNNLGEISKDVQALGTRHKSYGVKDEDFNDVATALLWTLEAALKDRWNEDVKQAWIEVYTTLAGVMKNAPAKLN
jgi:hemoglobin-like flavoprotein